MNEASSRYVDQIATQKLVTEKLSRVHHVPSPEGTWVSEDPREVAEMPQTTLSLQPVESAEGEVLGFPSPVQTSYPENNTALCRFRRANASEGEVIFVHGLYEDNLAIYDFLIRMLNEHGLSVYVLILPYHYGRRPAQSAFSGEYFWSADIDRSARAFKQAVADLLQLYRHVKRVGQGPVWVVGFSMGGGVALTLSTLTALDGVFSINPVCNLPDLMWHRPLFATVKRDLEAHGVGLDQIAHRYAAYDPLARGPGATPVSRVVLARGLYDEINSGDNYDLLIDRWRMENVLAYKAGHLNILRVPKLAADVAWHRQQARCVTATQQIALREGTA